MILSTDPQALGEPKPPPLNLHIAQINADDKDH